MCGQGARFFTSGFAELKILYINQYFPPEIEPSATKVHEVGRELVRLGHEVTVITGFPNYPTGVIPPEYCGKLVQSEELDGIRVLRTVLFPASTSRFFLRIVNHLSFMISSVFRSWSSGPCDVIICSSPPLEIALSGVLVSWLKRKSFIFEIRDLWPDDVIHLGLLKGNIPIAVARRIEKIAYNRASMVVPVSPGFVPYLVSVGVPERKIKAIVNGTNVDLFHPFRQGYPPCGEGCSEIWLKDCFVVVYTGTHGLQHKLETVLDTAAILRKYSDIHFVLAGDGKEKKNLLERRHRLGLTNVHFKSTQPREKIATLIAQADICLLHTADMMINTRNYPAKLFDYLASGKPIVIGANGQVRTLVEHAQAGIAVAPEDAQGMADAILRLYYDSQLRTQLGSNGRKYAIENFSRQIIAKQYAQLLKKSLLV